MSEVLFDAITTQTVREWIEEDLENRWASGGIERMPVVTDEQCRKVLSNVWWAINNYAAECVIDEYHALHEPELERHEEDPLSKVYTYVDAQGTSHDVVLLREQYHHTGSLAVIMYEACEDGSWEAFADLTACLAGDNLQNSSTAYIQGSNFASGKMRLLKVHGLATWTGHTRLGEFQLFSFTQKFFETCVNDISELDAIDDAILTARRDAAVKTPATKSPKRQK